MHRFFLPADRCSGKTLRLEDREAHHAAHVLRVQPGEIVTVLDGAGHQFTCDVRVVTKREVELNLCEKGFSAPLPSRITLVQAVPKGKTFDVIVQKATELGVHRVVPLLTERVVMKVADERDAAQKVEKWRQVAIESIKQCGLPWLPEISAPVSIVELLARKDACELSLVAALCGNRQHTGQVMRKFQAAQGRMPCDISFWIGPEGDFTAAELSSIMASGAVPVSFGANVLRAETAAIYAMSILNHELQNPIQHLEGR
jgi:16S rRNA (uracil1498-N3)-methyltransferase